MQEQHSVLFRLTLLVTASPWCLLVLQSGCLLFFAVDRAPRICKISHIYLKAMRSIAVASSRASGANQRDISIAPATLKCINRRFEQIARWLRYIFYAIAVISIVAGTFSSMLHAEDDESGIFVGGTASAEGLVFSIIKEIMSGILVAIPIQAAAADCQRAFALGTQYVGGGAVPARVVRFLADTNTLFFEHPFARVECDRIRACLVDDPSG